ncbi:hypothetical protein E4U13_002369 [Claviceps humidiphila]|uniref:Uncharacterized protein n=1 Tax=Claviceps humidiphila TaxID=1294629 RepID=A0A9P7Q7G3_9HYPO|nr:hypothetical protein E4U13_002369 [Claviceps humidiphila]
MARASSCLATLLAARNALVQAKPVHDERPLPTLDMRPIRVVTELGVSLSMSFPAPTNLVFCNGETLSISQAGFLSTVTTITHTQNASISSFAPCGTMGSDQIAPASTCDCSALSIGVAGVGLVGPMGLAGPQGLPGPPGPACTTIYTGDAGACAGEGVGAGAGAGAGVGAGAGASAGTGAGAEGGAGADSGDAGASAGEGAEGGSGSGGGQSGSLPAEAGNGGAGNGDASGGGANNGNNSTNSNGGNGGNGGYGADGGELDPIISSIVGQLTTLIPTATGAVPTDIVPIVSSLIGDLSSLFPTGIPTSILPTATGVNNGNNGNGGNSNNNGSDSTNSTNGNGGNHGNGGYGGDGGAQSALATELDPIISSIVGQLTTLMPIATGAVPTDVAPIVSSLIGDLSSLFPTGIPTSILPVVTSVNNGNGGNSGDGGAQSALATELDPIISSIVGQLTTLMPIATGAVPTDVAPIVSSLIGDLSSLFPTGIPTSILPTATEVNNGDGGNYGSGGGDDGAQSALTTGLDPIISSIIEQLTTLVPTATGAVPTDVAPIVSSLIGDLSSLFPTGIPTSILPTATSVNNSSNGNAGNSDDGGAKSALATELDPIISSIVGQLTTMVPIATGAVPTDVAPIVSSLIGELSSLFPTGVPTSILPTATEVNNSDGGNYGSGGGDDGAQSALTTGLDPIISSIVGQLTTLVPTATGAVPTDVAPIVSSLIGDLSSLFPTGIPTSILPTATATSVNSSLSLSTEVQSVVSSLPSLLPTGPLSSIIEGVVSVVTNVLPTNTITNLPTCAPGNPVCAIAPEACRKIGDISDADAGSQLAPQVAECTAALGPFAKDPNVLICIGNVALGPGPILACLTNALSEVCITALPGACTNLLGVPATQLSSATPQCGLALGPFLVDDSNKCLTGTLTSGDAVVSCLEKALGLTVCVPTSSGESTQVGNLATETEALTLPLPSEVQSILNEVTSLVTTLPTSPTLPSEVQSIVNEVTSLLPTLPSEAQSIVNEITTLLPTLPTEVQSIVNEITTLLPTLPTLPTCSASPPVCASVPQDCNAIGKISGLGAVTELPEQIIKCTTALGSIAANPAVASCLDNMAQGPTAIVNCLTTSLKSVCITELPGACTNLIGEPAAQLPSVAPQCALALGPFLVNDASQCLSGTPTSGDAVISCLQKAIGLSTCVPTVSGESTQVGNLATETEALTLPLLSEVQSIVDEATTLSPTLPSMVQTVVGGVTTSLPILSVSLPVDQISSIIGAITNVVPSNTIPSLATCSAGPPVCASVPQDCNAIGKISGLGAVTQLPGQIVKCTTALGSFATNPAVASCLTNVAQGPTAIVNCLTTSLKSVCITALPGACTNLLGEPAARLPSVAPECALALGPFLGSDASQCLNALTSGVDVVSCLEKALGLAACVSTASGESTQVGNLATETNPLTLPLPSQVQSIVDEVTTLLPSKVQTVVEGVTTSLPIVSISVPIAQISSIIGAITNVVPSNTVPSLATCSAGPPVCASVPQDCNAIGKISGLGAVTQLPGQIVKCTTALGSFATNPAVASCLSNVAQGPTAIVNCLTTSLKSVCITELPGACTNLIGEPAAQLPSVAPQCALALGPFLVSDASQCLNALTSGVDVVSCLQKAIGLSACVPTASGGGTQVDNLATETEVLTLPLPSKVQSIVDEVTTLLPTLPSMVQTVVEGVTTSLPILSVSLPVDQISSIIGAITNVVPSNTIPSLATCSAGPPVCASVPQDCNAIGKISGLGAVTQLPGQIVKCTTALGSFAANPAVASCLSNVAQGPTAIVNCLTTSLKSVCITELPGACTNLLGEPAAQLASVAPQCALALGPFLVSDASQCLNALTSGVDVVSCLQKALGLAACVPTASGESTQVGNLATATNSLTLPLPSQVQSIVNGVTTALPTLPTQPSKVQTVVEGITTSLPIVSVSVPIAQISSIIGAITNVVPSNTIPSLATCSAGPPVCASVPQDCNAIGKISGLGAVTQLPGQIVKCTTALGSFATNPAVASCLTNVAQGPTAIVNCLTTSLKSVCITELPGACTNLIGEPAAQLPSVAPQCALALGPFLVSDASQCLNALTSGVDVVSCLQKALGLSACVPTASGENTGTESLTLPLPSQVQSIVNEATTLLPSKVQTVVEGVTTSLPILSVSLPIAQISSIIGVITNVVPSNTIPSLATCSAGPPVCASVPQDCNAIGKISGLGAVTQLPGQIIKCTTALGSFATNPAVASCLSNVAQGPTAIVNCLTTSLKSVCITELPGACTNLIGEPAAQLPSVAPQCALALGPFLVSDASQCLNVLTSGVDVVSCLQKAIGLSACVPTASGGGTQVGNLATETSSKVQSIVSEVTNTLPTQSSKVQSIVNGVTTALPTLPTQPSKVQTVVEGVTTRLPVASVTVPVAEIESEIRSIVGVITHDVPSNTVPSSPTCSAGPPVCASVPQDCNAIGKISGLGAVTQLPGQIVKCTTSLGSFATNPAVASCLRNVAQGPTAIVNCLTTSLKSVCITELPGACKDLASVSGAQLVINAPQCTLALGPFLVNGAAQCLNSLSFGVDVVTCLQKAIGLSVCV